MTCTSWRGIEARLDWMTDHPPGDPGWCAREVWHALGGDQSTPCPPAWGAANANEVYDKIKASGRYWTSTPIPRGAVIAWKYGANGHAALSMGDGTIMTTDPNGNPGGVGVEPLDYPHRWGATADARIWTDQYNGVRFSVGVDPGPVYVDKLVHGQQDSDSVKRLQQTLNGITLTGGQELPITGNYGDMTRSEVALWQQQKATDKTVIYGDHVTDAQAQQLFAGTGHTVVGSEQPEPEPPDPEEPAEPEEPGVLVGYGAWDWYSGKKTGPVTIRPGAGWTDLPGLVQPPSGIIDGHPRDHHFAYFRVELTEESTARRLFEVRWVRGDGDATAYDHRLLDPDVRRSYGFGTYHTEAGSGLGGKWQAKATGGSDPVTITTHYAKTEIEWQQEPVDDYLSMSSTDAAGGTLSVHISGRLAQTGDAERLGLLAACLADAVTQRA